MTTPALLKVEDLVVDFPRGEGVVRAVNRVSFQVAPGEIVGLVGESGSGKSTTALALFGLVPPPGRWTDGTISFAGDLLSEYTEEQWRRVRGAGLAYVPQEPGSALNPVMSIGSQIVDVIRAHRSVTRREAWAQAEAALARVGIPDPDKRVKEYAHQFSGGMKQRALIALALAAGPRLLVADEPTTAIDVTLQAGILDLLTSLARKEGMAVLLITHDLGVVASVCDRVMVMYAGSVVEDAVVDALFSTPAHPYTAALLSSMPSAEVARGELPVIPGQVPDLACLPSGCAFHPRCARAESRCSTSHPELRTVENGTRVACFLADAR